MKVKPAAKSPKILVIDVGGHPTSKCSPLARKEAARRFPSRPHNDSWQHGETNQGSHQGLGVRPHLHRLIPALSSTAPAYANPTTSAAAGWAFNFAKAFGLR